MFWRYEATGGGCDLMLFENREQYKKRLPTIPVGCDLMLFENREQFVNEAPQRGKVVI